MVFLLDLGMVLAWIGGIIAAHSGTSRLAAVLFPPYAWYLLITCLK